MLVSDLRKEFYDVIKGKRVLVLVHCDVDAICASKILQSLFRADHILYTIIPIQTRSDLVSAYEQHRDQMCHVLLINCGGCLDLVDVLSPPEEAIIYVADSHRPLDICNIYSGDQVRVLSQLGEDEEVPAFEDVFREEESSGEDEGSDDEEGSKRRRFDEEALERRRARRQWHQQRHKIVFDYTQFSYFGSSSAMLLFDLAWKLSKDSNELLWWGIVGVTEGQVNERAESERSVLTTGTLQGHVSRLNHQAQDTHPLDSIRINFQKELKLALYRHWSLVESMRHSIYTSTTLKLWTLRGEKRLQELLAEMGLPLVQCRQLYSGMDVSLRQALHSLLEEKAEKYGLPDLLYPSFVAGRGFRGGMGAGDYVFAAAALMESPRKDVTPTAASLEVADCLSVGREDVLERGIEASKRQLSAVYRQVQTFLDMNQVISAGPFLYATVLQGTPDAWFFSAPHCLTLLARFTLRAHVSISRGRKSASLPLVLTTPDVRSEQPDFCLVCGIPPTSEDSRRNFFGKAFEQAAEKTGSRAQLEFFDTNIIRLSVEDRSKFFDALISLLS